MSMVESAMFLDYINELQEGCACETSLCNGPRKGGSQGCYDGIPNEQVAELPPKSKQNYDWNYLIQGEYPTVLSLPRFWWVEGVM